jgi:hypothetical protein
MYENLEADERWNKSASARCQLKVFDFEDVVSQILTNLRLLRMVVLLRTHVFILRFRNILHRDARM